MEFIIALLLSFFAYHADLTAYEPNPGLNQNNMQVMSGERPDPGRIDGPIIVVDDTHFRPPKTH